MTEHHVEVVRIGTVSKHPNADSLSVTHIHGGYPVIFRSGEYNEGDLAVYLPVDSLVPQTEEWAWLSPEGNLVPREKDRRIRAKKLRGTFSMGMLTKAPAKPDIQAGDDVASLLGITKYEPPEVPTQVSSYGVPGVSFSDGLQVPAPELPILPPVYDIEGFRKFGRAWFNEGEHLVVTEKIHGQNASFVHDGTRLHVKSRTRWLNNDPDSNSWADLAERYALASKLAAFPGVLLFGESYGNFADMTYGAQGKAGFFAFDAFNTDTGEFLSFREFTSLCRVLDIPTVPVLAELVWNDETSYDELLPLAEGLTTLGANHVREGFVIKPKLERTNFRDPSRVILKMHGEGFLTRKTA